MLGVAFSTFAAQFCSVLLTSCLSSRCIAVLVDFGVNRYYLYSMVLCLFVNCGFQSGKRKSAEQQEWEKTNSKNACFCRVPKVIRNQGDFVEELSAKRRRMWISAISRDDLTDDKLQTDRVCSRHFVTGKPAASWDKHNVDWIPTLNLGHLKKTSDPLRAAEKAARTTERRKRMDEASALGKFAKLRKISEPGSSIEDIFASDAELHEEHGVPVYDFVDGSLHATTMCDKETDTEYLAQMTTLLQIKCSHFTESYFAEDDKRVTFYTGLPSFEILKVTFDFVLPYVDRKSGLLSAFQQFVLVLMKLRLNIPLQDLAYRFDISAATVSRIFQLWIHVLDRRLSALIVWPEREDLWRTMPKCFQYSFGHKTTVIIDCFEVFIEKPSNLLARAQTFSSYKHHNTIKVLLGITPQGTISFVSKAWGGRTSDKFLTENCGILKLLKPGDMVMADRGFTIEESLWFHQAKLSIPAFTRGKKQLEPVDVEKTRDIANVRIHVERIIGQLRQKYSILECTLPIHYLKPSHGNSIPTIDNIIRVCCALINLCPPIIPFD